MNIQRFLQALRLKWRPTTPVTPAPPPFEELCASHETMEAMTMGAKRRARVMRVYQRRILAGQDGDFTGLCIHEMLKLNNISLTQRGKARRQKLKKMLVKQPVSPVVATAEGHSVIAGLPARLFNRSPEWRRLRADAFNYYGSHCMRCGAKPGDGLRLEVVHRVSRLARPELAFAIKNLWVLCARCRGDETAAVKLSSREPCC